MRNALIKFFNQFGRVQSLDATPENSHTTKTQSTTHVSPSRETKPTSSPRVRSEVAKETTAIPIIDTLHHSNLPKNRHFDNRVFHRYLLRSLNNTTSITEQQQESIQHIFIREEQHMSMDALLKGDDATMWLKSLSNES